MKGHGCIMEFTEKRDMELLRRYTALMRGCRRIVPLELAQRLVAMPSTRFWVSDDRAVMVIRRMDKGYDALSGMCQSKRQMYTEIYRRYRWKRRNGDKRTIRWVVSEIVHSGAPCYYLAPRTALQYINRMRKSLKCRNIYRIY